MCTSERCGPACTLACEQSTAFGPSSRSLAAVVTCDAGGFSHTESDLSTWVAGAADPNAFRHWRLGSAYQTHAGTKRTECRWGLHHALASAQSVRMFRPPPLLTMSICPCVQVICTSKDGDQFWRMPETYIRGNTIKYLRVPDEVIDKVKDEAFRREGAFALRHRHLDCSA